jgi:DNA-binding SARP family transcriptional activator
MLMLDLFGSVSATLHCGGVSHVITLQPRLAGVLSFLALGRGRYFARSEIAQSVWGEDDAEVGAGSLNTALWRLRRAIERAPAKSGDYIASNRQGAIGLNGPAAVRLDVDEFLRLTRPGLNKSLNQITESDIEDLRTGVSLYKGDALADISGDWVLRERERLRRNYLDTLGRLMHVSAANRDYDGAIRYAQSILYNDVLREDVHRELIRYFVLNGQRTLALRQFETCRNDLRRELAITPMRETLALYQRIADSAISETELERSLYPQCPPARGAAAMPAPGFGGPARSHATSGGNVVEHLATARQLIAQADSQLQTSLELIAR